jgi:DNA-binding beta-propeller fold protein YncE
MRRIMGRRIAAMAASLALGLAAGSANAQELAEQWKAEGFNLPESVSWDPDQRAFYVSNLGGDPMTKDGNGFISKLDEEGNIVELEWVTGLNAPKGTIVADGTLWTTDIDEVVEIDTATGEIRNRHPVAGSAFLNDIAIDSDGSIYLADTGKNAIFRLKDGTAEAWLEAPELNGPNGLIVVDGDLIVAALGDISQGFENMGPGSVLRIDTASKEIAPFNAGGEAASGNFDGIEPYGSGGVTVTAHPQGKLIALIPGQPPEDVASVPPGAADHEYVEELGLFVIPNLQTNTVTAYRSPS